MTDTIEKYSPPHYAPQIYYIVVTVVLSSLLLVFGVFLYKAFRKKGNRKLELIGFSVLVLVCFSLLILVSYYWIDEGHQKRLHGFKADTRIESEKKHQELIYESLVAKNAHRVKESLAGIPVLYINLDRSEQRRGRLRKESKRFGVNLIRVPGVDGDKLEWEQGTLDTPYGKIPYVNKFNPVFISALLGVSPTRELGALLAHLRAIYTARFLNLPYAIIIEDDVTLEHLALMDETIPQIVSRAPRDWEVINLFTPHCKSRTDHTTEFIPWHNSFCTTGFAGIAKQPCFYAAAYIINRRGIEKLANRRSLFLKPDLETKENEWPLSYVVDNYIYSLTNSYMCRTPSFLCMDEGSVTGHGGFLDDLFEISSYGQAKEYRDSIIRDTVNKKESNDSLQYYDLDRRTNLGGKKVLQFVEVQPGNDSFSCDMKKIWGPDVEAEFIADILFDYKLLSSTMENLQPSGVLAMGTNTYTVDDVEKAIDKVKPSVLLLLGDEWETRPQYERLFNKVPLVYRQYRYNSYQNPTNQLILPLGYHCWDMNTQRSNMRKKYIWSFIGSDKGERGKNLKILDKLKPNFHGRTKQGENVDILNSSIFVFCPNGNHNVETYRQYTASMCGAIPFLLCTDEQWNETYPYLDIEPPWLYTNKADKMVNIMRKLLQNPAELKRLQEQVLKWWVDIKRVIYKNIDTTISTTREA